MDGTVDQKDTSARDSSEGQQGTSEQPRTYTEADMIKARSDALAAAGRDAKSIEKQREEANRLLAEAQEAADKARQRQRDAELEAAKDDPDELSRIRKAHQIEDDLNKERTEFNKEKATLERERAEHQAEIEEAQSTKREIMVWDVATKHNVDAERLKDLSEKYKLSTKEEIDELARQIGKPKEPVLSDSGRTTGGTNLGDLPPKERLAEADRRLRQ